MKVILRIMSQTDTENISMLVAINMKDNGKTTSLMEKDKHYTRTDPDIMVSF